MRIVHPTTSGRHFAHFESGVLIPSQSIAGSKRRAHGLTGCGATLVALSLCFIHTGCRKSGPPYDIDRALKTFKVEPGFHIDKYMSEPDVVSPIAMDIDENGRMYVIEDRGYPLNTDSRLGRVKMLEDTNGDGIPDRVTIFADHLVMPTGVMRWKKGILVTDAPNLWYFEDTKGTGVADVRKIVLTGFAVTNPQHTVNTPVFGVDNWIYLATETAPADIIKNYKKQFGDRGSDIRFADRTGGPILKDHDHMVRLKPDTYELEALSGGSQYGHGMDDWGHHFTLNSGNHAREIVIAARYLERNPDMPVGSAVQDISDHGNAAKVYPITLHPRFEMFTDIGQITSACGSTIYRGGLFVAEPVHNLVHQDLLSDSGATYVARRAHPNVEFLASTDAWFRPVNFYAGPDGALYVMDFYRLVIEHPEWMSTEAQKSSDLIKGIDRGRIYRIVPDGAPAPKPIKLGAASNADLVRELQNPLIWWRRTAQRLLMDRKAVDATPDLVRMVRQSESPVGQLHALWTLDGLGKLESPEIQTGLSSAAAGVRENAIILAESRLAKDPKLVEKLLGMVNDADARVRFQLLCTLGSLKSSQAAAARDQLLARDIEDKWFQISAVSASSEEAPRLYPKAVAPGTHETPGRRDFVKFVSAAIGTRRRPAEIHDVIQKVLQSEQANSEWWGAASLEGLALGMRGMTIQPAAFSASQPLLIKLFDSPRTTIRRATLRLMDITGGLQSGSIGTSMVERAVTTTADEHADADLRADSISLIAIAGPDAHAALLKKLIDPHQPDQVQTAAVRAYGKIKGDDVGKFLLANWRALTPTGRTDAADAMYLEPSRVRLFLTSLKSGDVQPWALTFRHRWNLIMNDDPAIRAEAHALFDQPTGEREKVLKRYEVAMDRTPDPNRGREVYKSVCIKCHRFAGMGVQVGPDLATVQNQPKQALLEDILIPSKTIAQGYEGYVVETSEGILDGVLSAQTPTTIALRHENGKEDIVQRKDIKDMHVTNVSAMPGDLETQIDIQQMADLLEFLKITH